MLTMNKLAISATIITFNEESNIKMCIESLAFCEEVIVVDSFSSDKTVEIAEALGAKVFKNPFAGYGQQKNFAADQATHEWILNIDADEEVTKELQIEIAEFYNQNNDVNIVYQTPRLTQYCGKWIRHGGWYPNYVTRFYHNQNARWTEPEVHESLAARNEWGKLVVKKFKNHLHHYSFPTFKSQVEVNVKYAARGAQDLINRKVKKPGLLSVFIRPIGKFIECYLVKLGFLDGKEGLFIALNASYSMFVKYSIAYFDLKP